MVCGNSMPSKFAGWSDNIGLFEKRTELQKCSWGAGCTSIFGYHSASTMGRDFDRRDGHECTTVKFGGSIGS